MVPYFNLGEQAGECLGGFTVFCAWKPSVFGMMYADFGGFFIPHAYIMLTNLNLWFWTIL